MAKKREWSEAQDEAIRQMCAAGATWESIGLKIGLSRNVVIDRGRDLKVSPNTSLRRPLTAKASAPEDPNRGPLPAGDYRTWDLLMPGQDYPDPKRKD